jgi:sortase B
MPTTNDYLQIDFTNDDEYLLFLTNLKNRSLYNFNTTINAKDKILTLSTCYNKDEKMVMHAKLIKRETK